MAIVEYCTTDDVLNLTGVTVTDVHCQAARYLIDNYCQSNFQNNTVTDEIVSGNGSKWLKLKYSPILTVTKLEEDQGDFDNPNWVEIDAEDFKIPSEHGEADNLLLCDKGFTKGIGNYRVSYTWGYESVPDIVKTIACRIAAALKQDPDVQIKRESVGSYSVEFSESGGIKDTIDQLLKELPVKPLRIE